MSGLYQDPRLAALYDALNPIGEDTAFWLRLAGEEPKQVLDLGCGTGALACLLAEAGHAVTGVDPAGAMLEIARQRPEAARVRWVEAGAEALELGETFDLVLMTGHVFQVFVTDEELAAVLRAVRRHLAPGGRFAFDSRNPLARAWEGWTPERSRRVVEVEGVGAVEVWHRLVSVEGERVSFESCYGFPGWETLVEVSTLRFPAQQQIAGQLALAGFSATNWVGGWRALHFTPAALEIIGLVS